MASHPSQRLQRLGDPPFSCSLGTRRILAANRLQISMSPGQPSRAPTISQTPGHLLTPLNLYRDGITSITKASKTGRSALFLFAGRTTLSGGQQATALYASCATVTCSTARWPTGENDVEALVVLPLECCIVADITPHH